MHIGKRIGYFFLALVPALIMVVAQIIGSFIYIFFVAMQNAASLVNAGSPEDIAELLMTKILEDPVPSLVIYQVICLIAFGLWYFLKYGRKKRPVAAEKVKVRTVLILVLLGFMIQIFLDCLLSFTELLLPDIMAEYNKLMEAAGIGELTLLTFLSTVILAPLVEELCCRGLTYRFAKGIWNNWIFANIFQAAIFGIIHMNLVQGTYAFLIGLLLGYVYEKYHNIWACMLLHAAINGSSLLMNFVFGILPESFAMIGLIIYTLVSLVCIIGAILIMGKVKKVDKIESSELHS